MPIGTDSFEPTKVSRATVFPSFSVASRLTWGTINLKSIGEGKLQYQTTTGSDTNYYNIAKDLAKTNARNEEITDRQGNLYGYWCKVQTASLANDSLFLSYVPNTWKVRNAFRKFHFAREHMFREAGVTKREMGKYGRTLRPYFSQDHLSNGDRPNFLFNTQTLATEAAVGGEWTYSTLASSPTLQEDDEVDTDFPLVDEWSLTILDSNDASSSTQSGTSYWKSVGMVHSYNLDRMEETPDATAVTSVVGLNNPLASLRTQTLTSGEIVDIAEDQQLEAPPYDVADDGDSIEASWDYMLVGGSTAGATAAMRSWGLYFFPAGIIALTNGVSNSNALDIEVIGKELCKDVA